MDRITLEHMEFYGYHGCLPEERQQGQKFFVDAVLYLDLKEAGCHDDLSKTVNYAEVFTKIRSIVEGEPVCLIETVAERLAAMILKEYARILKVEITVHKPSAPIPGNFRDVSVCIVREQGQN
ncbi:dihydroneopterin aldolase [Mitsuokella sp. WILCCON 0060]|uniref:dihydroneopterin aldolase n=1 Tax=unclassified Mitsuokella TaxID=2637239 RepID=UPI003EFF13D9